jgi:hypothetical protein
MEELDLLKRKEEEIRDQIYEIELYKMTIFRL